MKRADRAALRWVELTIRRAGRRVAARYRRYVREIALGENDVADLPNATEEDEDLAVDIRRAFRSLPRDERLVLFLSVVADWPERRIAETIGRSQTRVSQLRRQALLDMRDKLEDGREDHA